MRARDIKCGTGDIESAVGAKGPVFFLISPFAIAIVQRERPVMGGGALDSINCHAMARD